MKKVLVGFIYVLLSFCTLLFIFDCLFLFV